MNKKIILIFLIVVSIIGIYLFSKRKIDKRVIYSNDIINNSSGYLINSEDGSVSVYDKNGNFIIKVDNSIAPSIYLVDPTFNPMP